MQRQNVLYLKAPSALGRNFARQLDSTTAFTSLCLFSARTHIRSCLMRAKVMPAGRIAGLENLNITHTFKTRDIRSYSDQSKGDLSDEDDDLCPVDCVREFRTEEEFFKILEKAKETNSLVVVDFYRTSCGSCKYIEQGFSKLCKVSGDQEAEVIFLKHNVIDEYDEQSEVAERLRIRAVPLFHFYKDGVLLEAFPTRDKEKITETIRKYTSALPGNS